MHEARDPRSPGMSSEPKPFRKFTDIIDRVEQLRNYLKLNKSQFSKTIGMKPQTYNNFIGSQSSKPSVELLTGIVSQFGVSPMWVLTGSGSMFLGGVDGRPGWTPTVRSQVGSGDLPGQEDGLNVENTPELALVEPILHRIEAIFDKVDQEHAPLLERLVHVLKRYSHVNPAGSAGELRDFLEHIERRISAH